MTIEKILALTMLSTVAVGDGLVATAATATAVTTTSVTRQVRARITLNVRTGPGTAYPVAGMLSGGAVVNGTTSGTWLKITSGSYTGKYVSTGYLVVPPAAPAPVGPGQKVGYVLADTTSHGTNVNVRAAMSFNSAVVGSYGPSARVVGTPQGDGTWWKVPGGYIHSAVLETSTPNPATLNAKIPTNQLCKINPAYYSKLPAGVIGYGYTMSTPRYFQCKALPALDALEAAYKARFGSYAGIDNAYRDWAEQNWWYVNYHSPTFDVSPAGKSNHGYGLAVDLQNDYTHGYPVGGQPFSMFTKNGDGRNWLVANESKFGFGDIGTHDSVHFNFVG